MNTILAFLQSNRERFGLERYGVRGPMSCLAVTPRFRASRHVVFLVSARGKPEPALVVKVARLYGARATVDREAANLRAVHALRPGGFASIPRLVACEDYHGYPMLIQTALGGRPMEPGAVRRRLGRCCEAVVDWLSDLQRPCTGVTAEDVGWFTRSVEGLLGHLTRVFPWTPAEGGLLDRTWGLVAALRSPELPLVFEHGDLSHPNLLVLHQGGTGVIDWEMALPCGLPAQDLFFFLTYAALAKERARSSAECVQAFQSAFFGRSAWARPYVLSYAGRLGLSPEMLTPLFVVCWARYVAGLLMRLDEAGRARRPLAAETVAWLRANRYYALWQYAAAHMHDLRWQDPPRPR